MYERYLFVGLGGSGGSTLGYLKNELQRWLEMHGVETEIPVGWQFLHIDTPMVSDAKPRLPEHEYLGLITAGLQYDHVQTQLDGDIGIVDEMQTWRVDPTAVNVNLEMGAGQFRAIGRTIGYAFGRKIRDRIDTSLGRVKSANAKNELGEVYFQTTGESPGAESPIRVVVVSSLAGGTGAGLLQTVCDILRARDEEIGQHSFGVLYTPEVFSSLGAASVGGVQPNSLAAICELLNGQWWNGSANKDNLSMVPDPKTPLEMTRAGLPSAITMSGPTYPFLVGRTSQGGIDHGSPNELYSVVGRSLLSWVTDRQVQRDFIAYTVGNWNSNAVNHLMGENTLINEGAEQELGLPSFNALGFARLSTGTEYFERYAMQRIVRDALEQVTRFHVDSREARKVAQDLDTEDPDEIADHIAESHLPRFLRECGLAEQGRVDNQILDALMPPGTGNWATEGVQDEFSLELRRKVRELSGIDDGSNRLAEEWRRSIVDAMNIADDVFLLPYLEALEQTTKEWIPAIQKSIETSVETVVALYGLKVAASICRAAVRDLSQQVAEELRNTDYEENRHWSTNWEDNSFDTLEDEQGKKLSSNDERIEKCLTRAVQLRGLIGKAHVADRAADLAVEVSTRVLRPMAEALEDALDEAEREMVEVQEWPPWSAVAPPRGVLPPQSEYSLIHSDDYHQLFEEMLTESFSKDLSGIARQEIRRLVTSGEHIRQQVDSDDKSYSKHQLCVFAEDAWYPNIVSPHSTLGAPNDLTVTVNASVTGLSERATKWLRRPGSIFGDYLGNSLRSYLGSTSLHEGKQVPAKVMKQRQVRFDTQLVAVLDAAQPLINLDVGLMGLVHPKTSGVPKRQLSQLPFAGHPIQEAVEGRLKAAGISDNNIEGLLTSDNSLDHIDITTTLSAPHSILVVESLLEPIAEKWAEFVASKNTQTFWTKRRSRPLNEFIPAPQALILCMVRGWLTALLLGRIDPADGPIRIARSGDSPAEFPYPFLSRGIGASDRLPLALEALGLAYVDVSTTGTLRPLDAYCTLRNLGRSSPDASLYTYYELHPDLVTWLETGTITGSIVEPVFNEGDDPEGRVALLMNTVQASLTSYQEAWDTERDKWTKNPISLSGPPQWTGLWKQIHRAHQQLLTAAEDYQRKLGTGEKMLK